MTESEALEILRPRLNHLTPKTKKGRLITMTNAQQQRQQDHEATALDAMRTNLELRKMLAKALAELGEGQKYWEIKHSIKFNNKLKSAGGKVVRRRTSEGEAWEVLRVEINPHIKDVELWDTVRHEALHIASELRDGDPEFNRLAKKNNIPLHVQHGLETAEDIKYEIYCPECEKVIGRYQRKGKYIKLIEQGSDRLHCSLCGSKDLEIIELDV